MTTQLLTPDEYQTALTSEVSDAEIVDIINRAMRAAIAVRSPFFRLSLPKEAEERATTMLAKWDLVGDKVAAMLKSNRLVHLKVSPKASTLGVFLLGDVVVVAEDVKAARHAAILAAEAAPVTPMWSAYAGGLLAAGDARQVDSSEVLSVYMWAEDGGTSVTHTAAEWVSGGWHGVIGPLDDSDLAAKILSARVHRPECDGVPCYCGEGGEVAGPEDDVEVDCDRLGLGHEVLGPGVTAVAELSRLLDEARRDLVRLTDMIGDAAKEIGVLCEGRSAMQFFPEVLAKTKADARLHSASMINEAYRQRNAMVCVAAQLASDVGLHAGLLVDEAGEPGFKTVVAIDLGHPPDGANQITFHMDDRDPTKPWSGLPPYGGEWDGHSDIVKWARIASYLDSDHRATGISEVAAVQLHLYSIGPYAYVAEDANEVYALHAKMVVGSEAQIDEQVAQATNDGRGEEIAEHVEVLKSLLHIPAPLRTVADDAGPVEAILTESGAMTLTAAEWIRRGKGFLGVRATHYAVALRPHLDFVMLGGGYGS